MCYPYNCSKKIVKAIQDKSMSVEDFSCVVDMNKRGVNTLQYFLPIWEFMDEPNYYPIHYACKSGDLEKVKILLEAGANPNLRDHTTNSTPLLFALQSGKEGRFMIADMLLDYGASPTESDKWSSPLFSSLIIVDAFDRKSQEKQSVELLKRLLESVPSTDDPSGANTLLGEAAAFGNTQAMEYILDNNINKINDVSSIGRTALMSSVLAHDNAKICKYLINSGAKKDIKDMNGKTAYDYAVELERPKCAAECKP